MRRATLRLTFEAKNWDARHPLNERELSAVADGETVRLGRMKGNEANHEIILMSKSDAEELILFTEMLLKFVYEFPNRVPAAPAPPSTP